MERVAATTPVPNRLDTTETTTARSASAGITGPKGLNTIAGGATPGTDAFSQSSPNGATQIKLNLHWQVYAMLTWLTGIIVLSSWLIIRLSSLRREHQIALPLQRGSTPKGGGGLPERFYTQLEETAAKLNLKRIPRVILTDKVACPAVFGIFRPVLLMPAAKFKTMTRQDTEHILLHELAHIKRGDLLVHAVYMIAQIAYWFNPLIWMARRPMQNLRELCCDATVAKLLRDKTVHYRQTLLETARQLLAEPVDPGLGLLGLFENNNWLVTRLQWLEKNTWKNRPLRIATIIALVAVMTACVLPMAIDLTPADFKLRYDDKRKTYDLWVSIQNTGETVLPIHRIRYYRGDPKNDLDETGNPHSGWHNAGPIEPGKTWNESTRDFFLPDGDYTFTAVLDYNNAIAESNETNNAATIHITIQNGHIKNQSSILRPQKKIEDLKTAITDGDIDGVKRLIDEGADINARDEIGRIPLHFVNNREIAELLIAKGADVNARTNDGSTLLHTMAWNGNKEMVEFLLKNGADVNAKHNKGHTPLHFAVRTGKIEVVKLLLDNGAQVDAKDEWGHTPLYWANKKGYQKIAELLLAKEKKEITVPDLDKYRKIVDISSGETITVTEKDYEDKTFSMIKELNRPVALYDADKKKAALGFYKCRIYARNSEKQNKIFDVVRFQHKELPIEFEIETFLENQYLVRIEKSDEYQCVIEVADLGKNKVSKPLTNVSIQTISFKKDMPLVDTFRMLSEMYKVNIIPSNEIIRHRPLSPVSNLYDVTFEQAIKAICGTTHTYEIKDKFVYVYTNEEYAAMPKDVTLEMAKKAIPAFFAETNKNISKCNVLELGELTTRDDGTKALRCKCELKSYDGETEIFNAMFFFDETGKVTGVLHLEEPVKQSTE